MAEKHVALLQVDPDFARTLANYVENDYPEYDVDALVRPLSRTSRLVQALRNDYDLIQVDETFKGGMLGALRSQSGQTSLVMYFRGWADYTNDHGEYGKFKRLSIKKRTEFVLSSADRVVYITKACRHKIAEEYNSPEGCVIHQPFNANQFRNADAGNKQFKDSSTVLTTVTNLRYRGKYEGVKVVLESLHPLFSKYDITYRVAGNGKYLEELEDYLSTYEYSDDVELLGFVSDVPNLLHSSDIFVYVSFLDSFGMAVVEAQAAGLPVVGSEVGGVPEAVGDAGIVCSPTQKEVREVLEEVISDSALREELSMKSLEKMENYNENIAQQFVEQWDEAID